MMIMKTENRPLRILFAVLLFVAIPVSVVLRTLQLLYAIDYATGFYKGWHFSIQTLDYVLLGVVVAALVLAFLLRKMPVSAVFVKRVSGNAILAFLCAAGLIGQLVMQFLQLESWSVLMLLSTLLTFVCIIAFLTLGFLQMQASPKSSAFLFRNIALTLWCSAEMLMVFFDHSAKSNTSEYVFVILFFYFTALFFVRYGKLAFYRDEPPKSSFSLLASSALMALFGFTLSVPNIIGVFFSPVTWRDFEPFSLVALPLAVYGLIFFSYNCLRRTR